jgi:hypothetical protein
VASSTPAMRKNFYWRRNNNVVRTVLGKAKAARA